MAENTEPLMDCNLPELLAVDLEQSSNVFKSRHLTAGAPAPALTDDGSRRRYSLQDGSLTTAFSSEHGDMIFRAKSLQTADQKYTQLFLLNDKPYNNTRANTGSDSDTISSECSGGLDMPSIGMRHASITTAATSVASDRQHSPHLFKFPSSSSPSSPPMKKSLGDSWVDLEVDDGVPAASDRSRSMVNMPLPQHLERREDVGDPRSMSLTSRLDHSHPPDSFETPGNPSELFGGLKVPTPPIYEKRMARPTDFPARRSSLQHKEFPVPAPLRIAPRSPTLPKHFSPTSSDHQNKSSLEATPRLLSPRPSSKDANMREDDKMSALSSASSEEEEAAGESRRGSHVAESISQEIVSPQINIESWLESSIDMFSHSSQSRADVPHSPMPLPPNVIETLRVSVSCFPETMLLCSSLSIETIRSSSRKLKYRADSLHSDSKVSLPLPPDQDHHNPYQPKPSRWKFLTSSSSSSRRPATPSSPTTATCKPRSRGSGCVDHHHHHPNHHPQTPTTPTNLSPFWTNKPDWAAIRNIFPAGTDYLCDALYAHLLAYNYITSLCPRPALLSPPTPTTTTPATPRRPPTAHSTTTTTTTFATADPDIAWAASSAPPRSSCSDSTRIPRKAASLLGLQRDPGVAVPEPPPQQQHALRSKRSFLGFGLPASSTWGGGGSPGAAPNRGLHTRDGSGGSGTAVRRPSTMAGPRPSNDHHHNNGDQVLRDLRVGLARCIARLVATLRLANSGGGGGGMRGGGEGAEGALKAEEDPLFMRTLFEVVRCCEER